MKINNNKIKSLFLLSLVGSGLGKDEKSDKQTGVLNDNQLPEMATNFTDVKVATASPEQNLLVAGCSMSRSADGTPNGQLIKDCTGGFLIINSNSTGCRHLDYGGFLASSRCRPYTEYPASNEIYTWDRSLLLGNVCYDIIGGIEVLYLSANLNNVKPFPFVPKTTDEGTVNLLPVISSSNPTSPGLSVCVYGAASGYLCGTLTELNLSLTLPVGKTSLTFNNLNKVDLGISGLADEDIGAPVYSETQIGERTLAQALGQITSVDNSDLNHHSFYYTPLEQALANIKTVFNCTYSLLTYNETNAQEYDNLLAQMEIPVKK